MSEIRMFPDEAISVYLYLKDQAPGARDEAAFRCAWQVICETARTNIAAFHRGEQARADQKSGTT